MEPSRGDIWWANLDPTEGSEQRGPRPVVIVSSDRLNELPIDLVWLLPVTTTDYQVPNHVELSADAEPTTGLPETSFVMCEQLRTVDTRRFDDRAGRLPRERLEEIDQIVRWLLGPAPT